MNNAKLSFNEMKEMVELFIKHRLTALRVGDFELQKSHYEPVASAENNKTSIQDDPMFGIASNYPPEVTEYLESVMEQQKKQWKK